MTRLFAIALLVCLAGCGNSETRQAKSGLLWAHDNSHGVTCWGFAGSFGGISCLPDSQLQQKEVASDNESGPSERIAIGEAIEHELEGRNGVRHDTATAKENFPEVAGQTRDIADKAAGFDNGKTYEQADRKSVV